MSLEPCENPETGLQPPCHDFHIVRRSIGGRTPGRAVIAMYYNVSIDIQKIDIKLSHKQQIKNLTPPHQNNVTAFIRTRHNC